MTIMGKTLFTYLMSSKNKISSRNCHVIGRITNTRLLGNDKHWVIGGMTNTGLLGQ